MVLFIVVLFLSSCEALCNFFFWKVLNLVNKVLQQMEQICTFDYIAHKAVRGPAWKNQ